MAYHLAAEETLASAPLQKLQRQKLAALLESLQSSNAFYQRKLAGIHFDTATDAQDALPFTTRDEIQRDQLDTPPYGTIFGAPLNEYVRFHETSGSSGTPMRWLDTPEGWAWFVKCWRIILAAAEVDQSDRVLFPFSFGPFIGFWAAFEAASQIGCLCLPGGGLSTASRLDMLATHRATVLCCTPTYALRMAEVASLRGIDLPGSTVKTLIVAGEPGGSIPATRQRIESAWGAQVLDHAGMTEIGPWGFQCPGMPDDLFIIESEFLAECIDPQTLQPVANGQNGELVLTNLGRWGSPLLRYRTGDMVRLSRNRRAGDRWFASAEGGILGRLDDMLFIRGNNVYPAAVEGVVRSFEEVVEFRMLVSESGKMAEMDLQIEAAPGTGNALASQIAGRIKDQLHFRPRVELAEPGALPRFDLKARRLIRNNRQTES